MAISLEPSFVSLVNNVFKMSLTYTSINTVCGVHICSWASQPSIPSSIPRSSNNGESHFARNQLCIRRRRIPSGCGVQFCESSFIFSKNINLTYAIAKKAEGEMSSGSCSLHLGSVKAHYKSCQHLLMWCLHDYGTSTIRSRHHLLWMSHQSS